MTTMTNEEYVMTQQQVVLLAELVACLNLDEFIRRLALAEAAGPTRHPSLYRASRDSLEQIKQLAQAAHAYQGHVVQVLGPEWAERVQAFGRRIN